MRRQALLALTISLAVASAHAQDVATLAGPIDLRGALERSSAHACSQSHASSSDTARLHLTVGRNGAATLEIDAELHQTMGPSRGRFAQGDRDFTHTTELARSALSGRATRTATGIEVRFTRAESSSVRFTGYGTVPLPAPTPTAIAVTMSCVIARRDVLPPQWSEHEAPTPAALLECTLDAPPAPLDRFEAPRLVFGSGSGVRAVTSQTLWDLTPTSVLRRAS